LGGCSRIHSENDTGEIRIYTSSEILKEYDESPDEYNWSDGIYQCDCNRHTFFRSVMNETVEDYECSDGKYSVNLQNTVDGKYYYEEF
jgi:hypothetical protein